VLTKQAKMRRDSIEAFSKGGRDELAEKETKELAIIQGYLPEQLDEKKIGEIARRVIAQTGAKGPQETKLVMPKVIAETKGRAERSCASAATPPRSRAWEILSARCERYRAAISRSVSPSSSVSSRTRKTRRSGRRLSCARWSRRPCVASASARNQ